MISLLVRQLLLLTLIVMSYLLFKNRHRAKAFLLGFLNFELVLVVEVRRHHHLSMPHPSVTTRLSLCSCVSSSGTSRACEPTDPPHPTSALPVAVIGALIAAIADPSDGCYSCDGSGWDL
jgi:hypothetical protein